MTEKDIAEIQSVCIKTFVGLFIAVSLAFLVEGTAPTTAFVRKLISTEINEK